jgi:hypothetical protein
LPADENSNGVRGRESEPELERQPEDVSIEVSIDVPEKQRSRTLQQPVGRQSPLAEV